MNKRAIILFGKYPKEGFVKTRLAKSIGDKQATVFYRHCLKSIFVESEILTEEFDVFFYYAEAENEREIKKISPKSFNLVAQPKGDLMYRIETAFKQVFKLGYEAAVIFATDVPELSVYYIKTTFKELEAVDCVIGPDSDGGYYCLGMRSFNPAILNISYGANLGTYIQTIQKASEHNITHAVLPEISDIDTLDDLIAFRERSPNIWNQRYSDLII